MSVYSPQYHAMVHSGPPPVEQVTVSAAQVAGDGDQAGETFVHHLLDVINPLQHLPVIGTLYRAITGRQIGPVEQIAGDTLYGGLWGAVSSIADVAFEGLTGKSLEETALGWLRGGAASVASAKVAAPAISADAALPSAELPALPAYPAGNAAPRMDLLALAHALSAKGVDGDMAQRALYAYGRSVGLVPSAAVSAVAN